MFLFVPYCIMDIWSVEIVCIYLTRQWQFQFSNMKYIEINHCKFFYLLLYRIINSAAGQKQTMDLQSLGTFVKYGSELLMGYVPRKIADLAANAEQSVKDMPVKRFTAPGAAAEMQALLSAAYDQLCTHLVQAHKDYRSRESKVEKEKLIHGGLSEQKQQELEQAKRLFEKLLAAVTSVADCTGSAVPTLQVGNKSHYIIFIVITSMPHHFCYQFLVGFYILQFCIDLKMVECSALVLMDCHVCLS